METCEKVLPMQKQGEGVDDPMEKGVLGSGNSAQELRATRVIEMPAEEFTAHGGVGFEYGAGRVNGASAKRMHALREEIGDAPLTGIERRWAYRIFKRTFDIVFSLLVLVCFCWLFVIIAILVKVDDPKGPVIFSQDRVGRDGRIFKMHKFRSMVADAEDRLGELQAFNEKTGPVFKIKNDPRVTRVGHWLRKLSLASVIIGTPGDGESTKSLPRSANSSLDLQLCERRPGLCCIARPIITYLIFLSSAFFGGQVGVLKRSLRAVDVVSDGRVCAVAQTACAAVPLAEDWTVAA